MKSVFHCRFYAVVCVAQSVYVADLITIVGGYRALDNPEVGFFELDQNFGVKVPLVGILHEWNSLEGFTAIEPIAGMEFRQVHSDHSILDPGEDPIAEKLVI